MINLHYLPLTEDRYVKDYWVDRSRKSAISCYGEKLFPFLEPIAEVAAFCGAKDIPLLYDGAHVRGLIAGGQFQSPL